MVVIGDDKNCDVNNIFDDDAFNRAEGASGNGFTKCVVQKKYLCF